ncbi:T-complex protein 11-domain-containing protein [Fennellomyces sp. T-0311]|nr:T-complex protein 11-domain-containing protein [Fennellomyces sp. T-0311]
MDRPEPVKYSTHHSNDNVLGAHSRSSQKQNDPTIDKGIVDTFYGLEFPRVTDRQRWLEFDDLSARISQQDTISITCDILDTFLSKKDTKQSHRRARIFLTAYVVLTCPNAMLQDAPVTQRKRLRVAAKRLLEHLEMWLDPSSADRRPPMSRMRALWTSYVTLFQQWLSNDKDQLLSSIIAHYQELQQIRKALQQQAPNVTERNEACDQLDIQLQQLEQKITSLGGAAALERIREMPLSNKNSREKKTSSRHDSEHALNMLAETTASSVAGLTNEQLAHELILDPNFKLQRHPSSIERQVSDIATTAFFDKVAHDMETDNASRCLLQLLREIRERLLDLVAPSMKSEVEDGIDLTLIQQEFEQKVFDMDKMVDFVLDVIRRSCARVRDNAVQEIRSFDGNNAGKLRLVFDLLQDMALDLANHQLRVLRPHLLPIAIEYSREKFVQAMQNQDMRLPKATQWLSNTSCRLLEVAAQRNPEGVPQPNDSISPQSIYQEAVTSLIMSPKLIDESLCPETLRLDIHRLQVYQNEAQAITIVAALLMLARNFGAPHDCHGDLAKRLFALLEQQGTSVEHLASEIDKASNMDGKLTMVRAMVDKTLSHTDAVYTLLARRVSAVLKAYLGSKKDMPDTTLQSYGLIHVSEPLRKLCVRIGALADYSYNVHVQWYDETIDRLLS